MYTYSMHPTAHVQVDSFESSALYIMNMSDHAKLHKQFHNTLT